MYRRITEQYAESGGKSLGLAKKKGSRVPTCGTTFSNTTSSAEVTLVIPRLLGGVSLSGMVIVNSWRLVANFKERIYRKIQLQLCVQERNSRPFKSDKSLQV
jgi:hypothetical protein